jgi:divalent metal cation (Fe/Co/Zn/Cd) transporter
MLATKENVSRLAIVSISALIVMKLITSFVTGSIGIRADAFHSLIDLAAL